MNLFHEAKKVLDKDGKVNPLGPYGRQKLTGREVSTYFRRNKVKDPQIKKAVEVALDLQGAMSVASSEIKKFYGDKILKSKEVQSALKYANESVEYDIREDLNEFRRYIVKGPRGEVKVTANSESDAITRARSGHMANTPRSAFSARMEGSFWGQDGMNKAAKKMFNKNTHVKLVKDKGSYQSATVSKTDTKKIAQLKKNGYKQVPIEALDKEDEKTVKDVIGQLNKAVKAHKGQVKTLTKDLKDSVNENYRKLAQYGMGTETSKSARVGLEHDFYDSKGNKQFGKIIQKTNTGYLVKDDKGKKHVLKYHDRKKAAKMLKPNYVHTESINEVTDKEINMAKKLSKDMEKVKKGYQQIAKTGDKTLKNTGFNPTYEAILKAQQKVLSLIGELNTMKIMSDRAASRQKDSKGRPIMNSFDTYRLMQDSEHIELIEDKVLKFTKVKDKSLEKHLKFVTKKVGAKLEKIAGGFQVSDTDMKGFTAVVDYIFDKSIKKNMLDGGGMSDVNMVNEGKYSKYSDLLLKKQRMPDNADKTQINKQISKERQKLNMSMWEDAIEENIERGIMKKMRRGRVAKGMPR